MTRPLTAGERALAESVFGAAIDYGRVSIARTKWSFFQPRDTIMAPCGRIHFHPDGPAYRDDFASAPLALKGLFIHEMTHVWQTQRGGRYFLPLMRHPFCRYDYRFQPGKRFGAYGLEQQAEIVRHYYLMAHGQPNAGQASIAAYAQTLPFSRCL